MKNLIEGLCNILKCFGIDPHTLVKSIIIFIILIIFIGLMITYPEVFLVILGILTCIALISVIYVIIE